MLTFEGFSAFKGLLSSRWDQVSCFLSLLGLPDPGEWFSPIRVGPGEAVYIKALGHCLWKTFCLWLVAVSKALNFLFCFFDLCLINLLFFCTISSLLSHPPLQHAASHAKITYLYRVIIVMPQQYLFSFLATLFAGVLVPGPSYQPHQYLTACE